MPVWGSYVIFATATILLGAVVGLVLVCIIDLIWPHKDLQRLNFQQLQEREKNLKTEALVGDELDDEDSEDQTSEGEKNSGSDSEEQESDQVKESPKASPAGSPDVRKRKTRKAD